MICKNCSNNIDDNVAFCPYCGTPTNSAQNNGQNPNVYYNPNTQQSNQYNSYNQQGTQQPTYQQANINSAPAKDKLVAGLLAIFLGSLGIHKFYLGYTKSAVIMLLVSLLTFGIGAFVMEVIGLIEGILYLTKSDEEFYQTYVQNEKEWF